MAQFFEAVAVEIYLTKYALMVASAGKHLHTEKPGLFHRLNAASKDVFPRLANDKNFPIGVLFDWKTV